MHAAPFQDAAQREDVARVVIDQKHGLADEVIIRAVQALDHALLVVRQVGDDAVQEQRGLVQQPLRRFDTLDDDAASNRMQLGVLFRRQLAAGEHDDRDVGERRIVADRFEELEARHVGQPQVEHDAIGRLLVQCRERLLAGPRRREVDVVMPKQLGDAALLGRVVFDDQQALAARLHVILDPRQRRLEILGRARLVDEGEGAAGKPVLAIFVERDDLHRDMPGGGVLL